MAQSSGDFMMYDAYQGMADVGDRVRQLAQNAHAILTAWSSHPYAPPWRRMTAYYELVAHAGFTHARPDYEIESVEIDGEAVPVEECGVLWTPFCQLLRFRKEGAEDEPKVLLIAPMSGHFATLLRGTIRTVLRDHTVFVTDWINPRNVKLEDGDFSLEDYTQHLIDFVRFIGEDCHIVAVCQPAVSALAATAILGRDRDGVQPASLTLMAVGLGVVAFRIIRRRRSWRALRTGLPLLIPAGGVPSTRSAQAGSDRGTDHRRQIVVAR